MNLTYISTMLWFCFLLTLNLFADGLSLFISKLESFLKNLHKEKQNFSCLELENGERGGP